MSETDNHFLKTSGGAGSVLQPLYDNILKPLKNMGGGFLDFLRDLPLIGGLIGGLIDMITMFFGGTPDTASTAAPGAPAQSGKPQPLSQDVSAEAITAGINKTADSLGVPIPAQVRDALVKSGVENIHGRTQDEIIPDINKTMDDLKLGIPAAMREQIVQSSAANIIEAQHQLAAPQTPPGQQSQKQLGS